MNYYRIDKQRKKERERREVVKHSLLQILWALLVIAVMILFTK